MSLIDEFKGGRFGRLIIPIEQDSFGDFGNGIGLSIRLLLMHRLNVTSLKEVDVKLFNDSLSKSHLVHKYD